MKKSLLLFIVLWLPAMLFAQLMDTATTFYENFDGSTITLTSGIAHGTDWQVTGDLSVSHPNSYHSPIYVQSGNSTATTDAIPLTSSEVNGVNHVYFAFDQICKVNQLDNATIYYAVATGYDEEGELAWGAWQQLSFTTPSPVYFGEGSFTAGKFNDNCYSTWQSSSMSVTPTNAWWKHEYFDLTSFVVRPGATHFKLQFRVNKTAPLSAGTEARAGWYLDNLQVILSNCELEHPTITLTAPIYLNKNNLMRNNIGPYTIHATIADNDTLNLNSLQFSYQVNSQPMTTVPNTIVTNNLASTGHSVTATWDLPTICYYDTIRYHIYVQDVHGSESRLDTVMIAWHDQTNIRNNDCALDQALTEAQFPHCLITGVAQPLTLHFQNKSDAEHSPNSAYQTALNVTLKVENENHVVTHNSTHSWTGSLCFDERGQLDLGTFSPTHGYNYITIYVNSRNGQVDGYHQNDTLHITAYSCDSILHGDYTVGGTNPDFADMEAVKASLNFCGINGPVTFHFRPGTYQGFDFRANYIGQSAVNTITFQGDNVNSVIVTNNHVDTNTNVYGAVTLMNVNNFIFKNLTLQGNNSAVSRGVVLRGNGSSNILFDGCKITAYPTNSTANTSFALGRAVAANTVPDTIEIRNCTITGGNYGVYYYGSNTRKNDIKIINSNISSCYRAIYTYYTNPIVQNNHITQYNMSSHQNFTGIYVDYAVGPDINGNTIDSTYDAEYGIYLRYATLADFFIRNNHVKVGNSNFGVVVANSSSTTALTGYVYNNEIILHPITATASYAMKIESSNLLKVINNSIYAKADAPYSNTAALYIQNNNNTYLDNNILYNNSNCADNTDFPLYLAGTSSVTGSYNDLISGSGVIAYKTVARNSISEFQTAETGATNNISLLPPMTDPTQSLLPTDFTGLECPRATQVTTDIRNIARLSLTHMGAYANQISATDASIVAMTNPASGTCPQGTYNITVSIANKGAEALSFANHHATVSVHSTALNLNQTVNVNSGTIPILGTMSQVVANNVSVPVNQNIDFTFIIRTTGDDNYLNDTLRTNFVLEAAIPEYEENFSAGTQQTWTIEQLAGAGNWSFQEGTGIARAIAPVYGTGRLFFNARSLSDTTESRAIMPVVVLTGSVNPVLEMWFAQDNGYSSSTYATEGVTVKISTDGGQTFTALTPQGQTASLVKRYSASATTPQWTLFTYDLSNYVSSGCVYIAFDARSRAGNNINIDRIRLRNLYDNDLAVTNIYAQGETPSQYGMRNVVNALVRNEGRQTQTNANIYLTVAGAAETYRDTVTIPSLASGAETLITFDDHFYNVNEVKNVQVSARNDQNNGNNTCNWRMVTTTDVVAYADTAAATLKIGDYNAVIRPCVRYKTNEELAVKAVRYYYDQSYIANPTNGFRAFVSNANGDIVATSDIIDFNSLQRYAWNTIPINNFAVTNMPNEFYVGIEMLSNGDYLCAQVESPLRDSAFYYLETNGTYTPQTTGRFMLGAVVDTPFVHDFAILDLQNPTSRCDLGHEQITIGLANNGSSDILPGAVLHYSINNQAAVSQTLTETLPSHQTMTFVFNTDYDFTNNAVDVDANYDIRVWVTKLAQDRLQYNDTLHLNIISRGKSATPIVTSPVNIPYSTSGTLHAQLPATISEGVIGWYASTGYESWELLGYTEHFTTPVIFFDTVFYANANPGFIFDTIVGTGTQTGTQPFVFTSGYSRGRILYTEDEIGAHGPITKLALYVTTPSNASAQAGIPIKIYLKESSLATFPTTAAIDWNSETQGATLVVDDQVYFGQSGWYYFDLQNPFDYQNGNLEVLTETNCADYCTGTGSQCNNCGIYVSGAASYPVFQMTTVSNGYVQYKNGNAPTNLTGNYSNFTKRLNMRFNIANLECGSEKVPVAIHVPDIPTYDVETQELVYPTDGCAIGDAEHIQVKIKNLLNQSVPANKVVVHATFNGTTISHTVDEAFAPEEVKVVTFTAPINLSAPTANVAYNYTIYTTMNNEAIVYRGNDTITGTLNSTYTAHVPAVIDYVGAYTQPFTILQPQDRPSNITIYYFYNGENDATPFFTSTTAAPTYTTPALYDTVSYWVSGKTQTSNCETKRIRVNINVFTPQYDLSTNALVYPTSYQCGIANSPQIQVNVGNTDTAATTIPAGTFNLTANFTGTNTANGTTTISTPISSMSENVTFANGINIGSATQNNTYTYTIYSNPANANMGVYRGNDTITGQLFIPANPVAPQNLTLHAPYGAPYTVTPNSNVLDYYYFYQNASSTEPFAQGTSFVTDPLYASTTYYYSGRIEDPDFENLLQIGTGTTSYSYPFTFTNGHSYGKILYSASEMGDYAGTIDTMFVYVQTANTSGSSIPVQMWMANGPDVAQITTATSASVNWSSETAAATKIFDGELAFDQVGWLAIPIPGGFDYTGGALYLYVEHNCGSASCVTNNGINPVPKFYNTSIQKKVLYKAQNTDITGSISFAVQNYRWNTKFKINHACESPKGTITVNTSIPQHDVGVIAINTPVAQDNNFTATEQVQVVIKNFGSQTATNIPVAYQLDNNPAVTQTHSSLAAGATATVTFTTPCDLSGVYFNTPFKAYTDLSNDSYHGNDTLTMSVSKEDPCISRPLSLATGADISNVTFAGINNGPGTPFLNYDPTPNDGLYTDYTETVAPAELVLGQTYNMDITHSFTTATATTVYKTVYIDYDRNGSFETSEQVFTSGAISNAAANATTSTSISIPTSASLGLTRMRVICAAGNFTSACNTYNYAGETEDYAVLLSPPMGTDIGIVNYLHPVGSICPDTNGRIRVIVKNYGSIAQSFSVTNPLTVTATVTGIAPGTYTTSLVSGSLQPGEETTVVLDGVDLSGIGNYNISTSVTYNGDEYLTNNVMTTTASTSILNNYISLPFFDNCDQNTGTDELHFTTDWEVEGSSASYQWMVAQGASPNAVNNGGPDHDHSQIGLPTEQFGRYATVKGVNSNYNANNPAWTTLTSRCLNLHYQNGYPVEVEFYKFFMGPSNSDFEMTIEVGSGNYFMPMDTLTKADGGQTFVTDPWTKHVSPLTGYDEVGRVRFKMTKQKYRIDPSIDDINIGYGLPDLAVNAIQYPYSFTDTIAHPGECLRFGDSIHPIATLQNNSYSPIPEYDVMCIMAVGNVQDTVIEHVSTPIAPGATIDYEFQHGFVIPENVYYCQFAIYAVVDLDKDNSNDTKRVISCSSLDVHSYESEKGVVLNQNVPNPASNSTIITYLVPDFGTATLNVYSAMGQLLYTETQSASMGQNQIELNTSNMAAGVYYYTLTFKNAQLTKKMAIQK
ncbi:MAG: GEVED domain-containing protein [Bacteroidales bacterium]|nr:GEVED domain-containing protein [Bacteroidales bacterium]